jgi:hypothetical protein
MVVGDEDVAERPERNVGPHELSRYPIAAVDDIRRIADEDDLRRAGGGLVRTRPTCGSEQDQPSAGSVQRPSTPPGECERRGGRSQESVASVHGSSLRIAGDG